VERSVREGLPSRKMTTSTASFAFTPDPRAEGHRPLPSTGGLRAFLHAPETLGLARLYHARPCLKGDPCRPSWSFSARRPSRTPCAPAPTGSIFSLGATPFLRWNVFKSLSEQGFTSNDLTDAALNPVTPLQGSARRRPSPVPAAGRPRISPFSLGAERPRGFASPSEEIRGVGWPALSRALRRRDGSAVTGRRASLPRLSRLSAWRSSSVFRHAERRSLRGAAQVAPCEPIVATHELSASFMANGYARALGPPGRAFDDPRTRVHLFLTGLAEALLDSSPSWSIVGGPARAPDGGSLQEGLGESGQGIGEPGSGIVKSTPGRPEARA